MAKPFYSFVNPKDKIRYFQIWDTIEGYPHTVPMDILTFLKFNGLKDEAFISVLYSFYPRLYITGCTMEAESFRKLPGYFRYQATDYLSKCPSNYTLSELLLIRDLESIFKQGLDYNQFISEYRLLTKNLNGFTKRQQDYYLSFGHTMASFRFGTEKRNLILTEIAEKHDYKIENEKYNYCLSFDTLFKNDAFIKNRDLLVDFFHELGHSNLININAIPHVLRNEEKIKNLFLDFGMESYLPETVINKSLLEFGSDFKPVFLTDLKKIRWFANAFSFSLFSNGSLIGKNLLLLSKEEILTILNKQEHVYLNEILNFQDDNGNFLLPMHYSSHFKIQNGAPLHVLSLFDEQKYHIVSPMFGLNTQKEYDDCFFFNQEIGYFQLSNFKWERVSLNTANNSYETIAFKVENYPISEIELEESYLNEVERIQREISQDDRVKILDLRFEKEQTTICVDPGINISDYKISYTNIVKRLRSKTINSPIEKWLYKINLNVKIPFLYCCELNFTNGRVDFNFNNGISIKVDEAVKNTEIIPLRASNVYYVLNFTSNPGMKFFFSSQEKFNIFQSYVSDFIASRPIKNHENIEKYANRLKSYLIKHGFKDENSFEMNLEKKAIKAFFKANNSLKTILREEDELPF